MSDTHCQYCGYEFSGEFVEDQQRTHVEMDMCSLKGLFKRIIDLLEKDPEREELKCEARDIYAEMIKKDG